MSSDNYYLDQAEAKGSAFYYSNLHLPKRERQAIRVIQAFYLQLIDIVYQATDANIAQIKFAWWRDEISHLNPDASEKLKHPLSILLREVLLEFQINLQELLSLIDGVEEKIHIQPFMTFEELTIHIMRTTGLKEKLFSEITKSNANIEVIYQLAMVEELVYMLQNFRRDILKGIIFFPVNDLDQFAVTVPTLERLKTTKQIQAFLSFQAERILNLHRAAINQISLSDRKGLRGLLIRSKIALATLKEIKKENFQVLEHFTQLTPLRMWWISLWE